MNYKQQIDWQQLVEAHVICHMSCDICYIQFEEQRIGWFQEGEAPSMASAPGLNDHLLNLT